jgi:hypothetical protein
MKTSSIMVAGILWALAGSTLAQNLVEGVVESTDPAKVAEVEQHAEQLRSQAQTAPQGQNQAQEQNQATPRRHAAKRHAQRPSKMPSQDNKANTQ